MLIKIYVKPPYKLFGFSFLGFCRGICVDIIKHKSSDSPHGSAHSFRHHDIVFIGTVRYYVVDQSIQPLTGSVSENSSHLGGDIRLLHYSCSDCIIYIMVDVCDLIGEPHDFALECGGFAAGLMVSDPVSGLPCKIKPLIVLFKQFNHPHALLAVFESKRADIVKGSLTGVTEGSMPQIMPQSDSFREVLVQAKCFCNCSRILGNFKSVSKPCSVMITLGSKENLGFILEPSE